MKDTTGNKEEAKASGAWLQKLREHDETWKDSSVSLKDRVRRCGVIHEEMCVLLPERKKGE